jgi:uncharacterized membrane protein
MNSPPTINFQLAKSSVAVIILGGIGVVVYMATRWDDLPHLLVISVIVSTRDC